MDWPRPDEALFRAASVHGRHHDENGNSKSRAPNPRIVKLYDAHFSSYEANVSLDPTAPVWGAKTGKELHNGRWTSQEHLRFLQGLEAYGKDWKKIQGVVGTRSGRQVRSHGQKYFQRFEAVKMSGQIGDNDFHVIMDGKKTFGRNRPESIGTHPGQGNSRVLARVQVGTCAGDRKPSPVSLPPCGSCLPPSPHRPLSPGRPKPSSSRKPHTMAAWALRPNAALPSFASKLTAFSSWAPSTEPLPSPSSPPRPPRPTTDRPPRVASPCLTDLVLLVQEGTASYAPTTASPSSFVSASVLSPLTDPSSCGDTGFPSRGEDGSRTEGSTETSLDEDAGPLRSPSPQSWAPAPAPDISLPDQAEVGLGTKSRKRPIGLCSPGGAAQRPRQGDKEGETWENPVEATLCQEVLARF
ncbi:hypothetical protein NSK_006195 [Nannochloropsis salina CCMP1776]|uniref:Uncharacterized protein n=1 Tax=Nannochloropsis salina CCMP1776 TaxID=1027361 RepID=A0A4D9CWL5_9STRA|nr:hypothetical protein NSK_006195 [Nannochloropsis salina CCMP1776]|eukprot:TFJ82517.1 hypothetical protein NSK_006195 [Nannochloropsis salina CCMP1776]